MYNPDVRASPAAVVASKVDTPGCEANVAALREATLLPVMEIRYDRDASPRLPRALTLGLRTVPRSGETWTSSCLPCDGSWSPRYGDGAAAAAAGTARCGLGARTLPRW